MSARISSIRVPREFKELVDRESKRRGVSVKQLIVKAVQHYAAEPLEGMEDRTSPERYSPGLKLIVTKFKGVCHECGITIPIGSHAWYGASRYGKKGEKERRAILICVDCTIDRLSDRGLAKLYIKKRELQAINRGLKKENEELADNLFDQSIFKKNDDFINYVQSATEHYTKHLSGAPEEEKENLEKFLHMHREAERIEKGMKDFLYFQMQRFKKKPRKKMPVV